MLFFCTTGTNVFAPLPPPPPTFLYTDKSVSNKSMYGTWTPIMPNFPPACIPPVHTIQICTINVSFAAQDTTTRDTDHTTHAWCGIRNFSQSKFIMKKCSIFEEPISQTWKWKKTIYFFNFENYFILLIEIFILSIRTIKAKMR